ncbi:LOW QUALITY PROTEIN: hypothetical protein PanWU01x14_300470 [Parasponia andersonii]|uniref:Uncharacterized protein n=1 Tax=Parasponia andersonii TaxID=3476 RepID=A0A2P5ATZ5_PARAD|nr:LOW QUALITY PROTEIN: hypothetical protein PanWU01x14_300470 [Parasponia andersonii]
MSQLTSFLSEGLPEYLSSNIESANPNFELIKITPESGEQLSESMIQRICRNTSFCCYFSIFISI